MNFDAIIDTFGQTVTVTFADASTREITAAIDYEAKPENAGGSSRGPTIRVLVHNDSTKGISKAELTIGRDTISITEPDGVSRARIIREVVHAEYDGLMELILR